ncbi:MAG: shikimate dehydrogenase [Bacteroidota bacterium]
MEKIEQKENRYGLIGKNISYSFSKGYFTKKFTDLKLTDCSYENFDLKEIAEFEQLVPIKHIKGFNVTIPYKETIIPYLRKLDETALQIGAVNTIKITENGLKGFNTDSYGFEKSLEPLLKEKHRKALILGTGGASKAIAFVLNRLDIEYQFVSRTKKTGQLTYKDLNKNHIAQSLVIVNCTPLGTYPNITAKPNIPYQFLTEDHLLYDLIYNPDKTAFLAQGEKSGATLQNGLRMLELQAEKAWEIWNS